MERNELLRKALTPIKGQRPGQAFMNSIFVHQRDLYYALHDVGLDAFYDDTKVWAAVEWITNNWKN
jgi:hypothetical protein